MLFDKRIKVGVSVAGLSTWKSIFKNMVYHNFAIHIQGMLKIGDFDSLLPCIYPRPFMMINGERDPNFPIEGVIRIRQAMESKYKENALDDRFELHIHADGHGFSKGLQNLAFAFLRRWLIERAEVNQ